MSCKPPTGLAPDRPSTASSTSADATARAAGPGVLTTLLCEQCGNENLIRVKGCWYCERCRYKFDCYGF